MENEEKEKVEQKKRRTIGYSPCFPFLLPHPNRRQLTPPAALDGGFEFCAGFEWGRYLYSFSRFWEMSPWKAAGSPNESGILEGVEREAPCYGRLVGTSTVPEPPLQFSSLSIDLVGLQAIIDGGRSVVTVLLIDDLIGSPSSLHLECGLERRGVESNRQGRLWSPSASVCRGAVPGRRLFARKEAKYRGE